MFEKIIFIILVTQFAACDDDVKMELIDLRVRFEEFKAKNNHTYKTLSDEFKAFLNFKSTLSFIGECNQNFKSGNTTFRCAINNNADQNHDYFAAQSNAFLRDAFSPRTDSNEISDIPKCELDYLNYAEMGYMNGVRHQGKCAACWAFAVAGICEAALYKRTKVLEKFSEQHLIDCTKNNIKFLNFGCNGGHISHALEFYQEVGVMTESDYGSYGYDDDDSTCNHSKHKVIAKVASFTRLSMVDEEFLKNLLCEIGPVTVAVDSSSKAFQFYKSGVFDEQSCTTQVNHAMILVGFGTDPDYGPYWILKNSHGKRWGENGYMRLVRGRGNACGILEQIFTCNI